MEEEVVVVVGGGGVCVRACVRVCVWNGGRGGGSAKHEKQR